jgi:predicted RNase H-like HicB family nuclease
MNIDPKQVIELSKRQVILYPGEDGWWVVECPSLPGCVSQGKTEQEAIANIKEAMEVWIADALEHSEPIPEDTRQAQLLLV